MFCKNCGKEINDNAVVCINCGATVNKSNDKINGKPNAFFIVLSVLFPILGFIISAVCYANGKEEESAAYLVPALVAILINIVLLVIIYSFYF